MMPNIDLRTLNARTYETADMLAASGVSLPRFKQWSLRGIDFSETPAPGKGKRRIFRLYAAYAYATIASLCDEAGLQAHAASGHAQTIMFHEDFTGCATGEEAKRKYDDIETWPAHMRHRKPTRCILAVCTPDNLWLSTEVGKVLSKDGTFSLPNWYDGKRPKAASVLNVTELLCAVDEKLAARIAVRGPTPPEPGA